MLQQLKFNVFKTFFHIFTRETTSLSVRMLLNFCQLHLVVPWYFYKYCSNLLLESGRPDAVIG